VAGITQTNSLVDDQRTICQPHLSVTLMAIPTFPSFDLDDVDCITALNLVNNVHDDRDAPVMIRPLAKSILGSARAIREPGGHNYSFSLLLA
jgi:hypothetical protein